MSKTADFCASCGRKRGDGRRDRGWMYLYADLPQTKLVVRACYCAGCKSALYAAAGQVSP